MLDLNFSATVGTPATASITLTTTRMALAIAPEHITVRVTDWTGFSVDAPAAGVTYDERLHQIDYYWTIEDSIKNPPPAWDMPQRSIGNMLNAGIGYGPMLQTVLPEGTWTITCVATHPATGDTATASSEVTIAAPETVYPSTRIVAIDGTGLPDWAGKPTGALEATTIAGAEAIRNASGGGGPFEPWMFVLRKGATYELDGPWVPWNNHVYFGTFGSGTRPVITESSSWSNPLARALIDRRSESGSLAGRDNRVVGINFKSGWDADTETVTGAATQGFRSLVATNNVIDDCVFEGCPIAVSGTSSSWALNNCSWTDWTGMGVFISASTDRRSDISIIGCSGVQNPAASGGGPKFSNPPKYNEHGPVRLETVERVYIRGCDFFSNCGWSSPFPETAVQACLRIQTESSSLENKRGAVTICNNIMESGSDGFIWGEEANGDPARSLNGHVMQNVCLGTYRSQDIMRSTYTGWSIYNNVMIIPDFAETTNAIRRIADVGVGGGRTLSDDYLDGINHVYNNTTFIPDNSTVTAETMFATSGVVVNVANNILQLTTPTETWPTFGPFVMGSTLFAPYMNGTRWTSGYDSAALAAGYAVVAENSARATPADTMKAPAPDTGSPALGTATTGMVAYRDYLGAVRPATKDKGAVQVSA